MAIVDGLGIFGGPFGIFNGAGSWAFPVPLRPNPGLNLNGMHLQAVSINAFGLLQASSPLVIDL